MSDRDSEQPIAEFQKIKIAYDRGKNNEALTATHGHFSEGFYRTLDAAIKKAPGVIEHVISLITASGGAEDRVDGTREVPLPMSTQAFSDVNEIYSILVYWTKAFAEQFNLQMPGPAARAWRNDRGTIVGLPTDISASDARYLTGVMTTWLGIHLENICELDPEDVTDFRDNLRYVFQTDARWPQQEKPRYSDMPCTNNGCNGKIAVYPPRNFGDSERIICETCGLHYEPDQYEELIIVFRQARIEMRQAQATTAHLMKKYQIAG